MVHTGGNGSAASAIFGRAAELARIDGLLGAVRGDGAHVLVLTGEPGAGKSTLVEWAAEQGAARGLQTLRVRGSEAERELALAGLHQLLRPLLGGLDDLPERQRAALRCAFGLDPEGGAPADPLHLCVGVTTLITEAAARQPLLLVVDDLQWLDLGSLDILAFVARRLDGEAAVMLLAAREGSVPGRFDRDFPHLVAGPLCRGDAGLLLNAQPVPPTGRARSQVLQEAAGNPLALIELSRAVARGTGRPGAAQTLPLTRRLEDLFAAELPGLPPESRAALLLVAAAGTSRLADIVNASAGSDVVAALLPAEEAGLLRLEGGQVVLRHPLVRSAVYQAASFAERRAAHLALADAAGAEPDRRAWHLAAGTAGQDAEVADALAETAERARARGGYAAAAAALERAAELTSDPELHAQRLVAASRAAMLAGHPQWAGDLASRIGGLTADPVARAEGELMRGWALGLTLRHQDALAASLHVAESMAGLAPPLGVGALGTAATSAYNTGDPFYGNELLRIGRLIPQEGDPAARVWSETTARPFGDRPQALWQLHRARTLASPDSLADLGFLGATAWVLDETDEAVRILCHATDLLRRAGTAGSNATFTQALALAHAEAGSWGAAQAAAENAYWMAAEAGADNVTLGSLILQATLGAFRGDHQAACARVQEALCGVDLRNSRSLRARYHYALGMAKVVEGDHESAYVELRNTFTHDYRPDPVHYHASLYYLADLAAAAVRAGQTDDARAVLAAARRTLGDGLSPRLHAVAERAAALVEESEEAAERHFRSALADPAGDRWPFERALARLDFGEWLRRHRRSAEARGLLIGALETFRRLDARPWTERAAAELRAAGAAVPQGAEPAAKAELTPQELQIAELAAQGLTNRDIASRLYLSPRTVGYHLHKVFPKLGVKSRAQLRDALSG
ncbi:AAA family ATPase [Kitasatospora sp. NPDC051984]|uniref:AAA family ATPase n=1 Tax=Kitasatospora sp. NPDC051984 TaxID=3364059 RepID=UPI0037CC8E80